MSKERIFIGWGFGKKKDEEKTFIELCMEGKAKVEDIDDYIDRWHIAEQETELELYEFLGMSRLEYAAWLSNPSSLSSIVIKHIEEQSKVE